MSKVQVSRLEDANFYILTSTLGYGDKTLISESTWDCENENSRAKETMQYAFVTM